MVRGSSGHNCESTLSCYWVILQCPLCRRYWDKQIASWKSYGWQSPDLLKLCMSQPPACSQGQQTSHPHSIYPLATPRVRMHQLPTSLQNNILHIEVIKECYLTPAERKVTLDGAYVSLSSPLHISEGDYYFSVQFYICGDCNERVKKEYFCGGSIPRPSLLKRLWWNFKAALQRSSPTVAMVSKHNCSPHDKQALIGRRLTADCVRLMLTYLPVTDLNTVARVTKGWTCLVSAELQQFARLVEAWNQSLHVGVYVSLDNHYLSRDVEHLQCSHRRIFSGGYLRLLPAREIRPGTIPLHSAGNRITSELLKSSQWKFAKPSRHASPSLSYIPIDVTKPNNRFVENLKLGCNRYID